MKLSTCKCQSTQYAVVKYLEAAARILQLLCDWKRHHCPTAYSFHSPRQHHGTANACDHGHGVAMVLLQPCHDGPAMPLCRAVLGSAIHAPGFSTLDPGF